MRCSPKLCIGLILVGIGSAAVLGASGYVKAASLISFLPILLCPLMCIAMMMFGRKCESNDCQTGKRRNSTPGKHL